MLSRNPHSLPVGIKESLAVTHGHSSIYFFFLFDLEIITTLRRAFLILNVTLRLAMKLVSDLHRRGPNQFFTKIFDFYANLSNERSVELIRLYLPKAGC